MYGPNEALPRSPPLLRDVWEQLGQWPRMGFTLCMWRPLMSVSHLSWAWVARALVTTLVASSTVAARWVTVASDEPALANSSALEFPRMSACPGIHRNRMKMPFFKCRLRWVLYVIDQPVRWTCVSNRKKRRFGVWANNWWNNAFFLNMMDDLLNGKKFCGIYRTIEWKPKPILRWTPECCSDGIGGFRAVSVKENGVLVFCLEFVE